MGRSMEIAKITARGQMTIPKKFGMQLILLQGIGLRFTLLADVFP
jgi:hypothetical protein